jgi:LemA protein
MNATQIAWVLAALVLACWALGAYNRLVGLRNSMLATWAQVEETVRAREPLLSELSRRLRAPLAAEHAALDTLVGVLVQVRDSVAALRGKPFQRGRLAVVAAYELDLAEALAHVCELIEHAPRLDGAPALTSELQLLLLSLDDQAQRLAAARYGFNQSAASHDAALAQFPTRLLGPWFGFQAAGGL